MARNLVAASTQYLVNTSGAPVSDYPISMAAWYRPTVSATFRTVLHLGKTGARGLQTLFLNSSHRLIASTQNDAGTAASGSITAGALSSNIWYHVGGVWASATSRQAVLNGTIATADTTNLSVSGFNRTYVGAYYDNGLTAGLYGAGDYAEVGIWNVALSQSDWDALAAGVSPMMVRPDALVGHWPLHARATDEEDWFGSLPLTNTNGATAAAHPRIIYPARQGIILPAGGAVTHTSSGALAADVATVAGTAVHLTLHATSGALSAGAATVAGSALHPNFSTGALSAGAATVAGTAAHLTLHATSGALAAGAATVAGDAENSVAGGTHTTSGDLTAGSATVAGSATHLTLHATSGALSASAAQVSGTAAHLTVHTTSGALVAGSAAVEGIAFPGLEAPSRLAGGFGRRFSARVDGKLVVGSRQEIEALLRRLAEQHAEEDEKRIEKGQEPKKRVVKVVSEKKAEVQQAKKTAEPVRIELPASAPVDLTEAMRVYEEAYEAQMHREAIRRDDEEVSELVNQLRKRRTEALGPILQALERLQ